MGDDLNPVGGHGEERSSHNTVIKPPFDDFEGGNAEEDLSDEADIEGVGDCVLGDVVVVSEGAGISVEESKADGVCESDQTEDEEVEMGARKGHEIGLLSNLFITQQYHFADQFSIIKL